MYRSDFLSHFEKNDKDLGPIVYRIVCAEVFLRIQNSGIKKCVIIGHNMRLYLQTDKQCLHNVKNCDCTKVYLQLVKKRKKERH